MGFGANGGFDFTKELKEMLRKKKENRELIVKNYEKKRGLGSMVDLILYRNKTNYEEKRWGLEPMVDLILLRN